jgi:hypothetical protein
MPVIKTARNRVVIEEPEADDRFARVVWHGPHEDGLHLRGFEGPPWPIADYQATIDWAVSMADAMAHPLYVVPMRNRDVFRPADLLRALPHLDDQDRGRLRATVVKTMAEIMRDCDDPAVRADAYEVLAQMKVVA